MAMLGPKTSIPKHEAKRQSGFVDALSDKWIVHLNTLWICRHTYLPAGPLFFWDFSKRKALVNQEKGHLEFRAYINKDMDMDALYTYDTFHFDNYIFSTSLGNPWLYQTRPWATFVLNKTCSCYPVTGHPSRPHSLGQRQRYLWQDATANKGGTHHLRCIDQLITNLIGKCIFIQWGLMVLLTLHDDI